MDQINTIKEFSRNKPFKVTECDKNIGCAILSLSNYNNLCFSMLSDVSTYKKIDSAPLNSIVTNLNFLLDNLLSTKCISKKLYKLIKPSQNMKLGSFRILPKLHKNKFGCRPIINCRQHPTSNLCLLIELLLRPHVINSETYIRDSQDLMLKCSNLIVPDGSVLYSCDFESLYTNIVLESLLNDVTEFIAPFLDNFHLNVQGFYKILKFILYNNYFKFDVFFYLQIVGIAMGIICGPSLATIYLYNKERLCLSTIKPIIYVRFIDDIFLISLGLLNLSLIFLEI
jgi:hypothetical protein